MFSKVILNIAIFGNNTIQFIHKDLIFDDTCSLKINAPS